jgi:hypothetical protein
MQKVLISLPDQLANRMKATIPDRQRSKVITSLLEAEVLKREKALYECALAVESDIALKTDMDAWYTTVSDGLHDEADQMMPKERHK